MSFTAFAMPTGLARRWTKLETGSSVELAIVKYRSGACGRRPAAATTSAETSTSSVSPVSRSTLILKGIIAGTGFVWGAGALEFEDLDPIWVMGFRRLSRMLTFQFEARNQAGQNPFASGVGCGYGFVSDGQITGGRHEDVDRSADFHAPHLYTSYLQLAAGTERGLLFWVRFCAPFA